ncbi:hypothetical protein CYMTET_2672 [Cymbomonas tetramitiformis]|uniref:Uncharacterized protein n=1 Tax=Cymbomonas tetramitiformis TaxID=36881 RepID=A0AAE0LLT5_9CHLO|nr:hypothetical protein CYMTET_2672 [Cymbomonas tetramitiformis]
MARDMLMVDAELCEDMAVMREDDPELYTPMQDADEVAESYRKYVIRVELHNILNRLEVDYTDRNRDAVIANDTSGVLMRRVEEKAVGVVAAMAKEEEVMAREEEVMAKGEAMAMGAMVKEKVERVAMVKEGEAMARGDAAMREEAMVTTAVEEFECTKRWCLRFARM